MVWCLMVASSFEYSNIIYEMYIQDVGELKMDEEWLMWHSSHLSSWIYKLGPHPHLVA